MPRKWEFFVECHLDTQNVRQRKNWRALHRQDQALRGALAAQFSVRVPKDALVDSPHPMRRIDLLVIRQRLMDDDALGGACKPLMDALKTRRKRVGGERVKGRLIGGAFVTLSHGVVYDDSRKYARITFDQKTMAEVGIGAVEGVRVIVEEIDDPKPEGMNP